MLKIVSKEVVRAAHVVNRLKVLYERMQIPKVEPTSMSMDKGLSQFKFLQNDVEGYQNTTRVRMNLLT